MSENKRYVLPNNHVLLWYILALPSSSLDVHPAGVQRRRYPQHNIRRTQLPVKQRPHVDRILHPRPSVLNDDRLNFERELDVGCAAVFHELEFAVGRDEGDGTVDIEFGQSDALVELTVVELDCVISC